MNEYENIVSLGFFCSTAQELERIGLRDSSSPFDWLICSDFEKVIELIQYKFSSFLNFEYLYQDEEHLHYYHNIKYNLSFYHDFNKFESLETQIPKVKEKYDRRIERFYKNIYKPTLFIRYISDKKELKYIEDSLININNVLKSFNNKNELIFISNDTIESSEIQLYKVKPDKEDTVSRNFLKENNELYKFLDKEIYYPKEKREKNLKVYKEKYKQKMSFYYTKKIYNKFIKEYKNKFYTKYKHYNSLDPLKSGNNLIDD